MDASPGLARKTKDFRYGMTGGHSGTILLCPFFYFFVGEDYLDMQLNPTQQQMIRAVHGPVMVVAGPGSGKTAVITARAGHLIENKGILPPCLLIMTFTKAAANEMYRRLEALVGLQARNMHIRTIHGFAYQLLRHTQGSVTLVDEGQQRQIMGQLLRRQKLSDEFLEPCIQELSNCVNRSFDWETYEPRAVDAGVFRRIVGGYQEWKQESQRLDFDDLLQRAAEILEQMPPKAGRFLMVDEFQDTSALQYRIIQRLSAADRNLFVVGDDDQSIYGWRGASHVMAAFAEDYPEAQRFALTENYRCSPAIVAVTGRLIQQNQHRLAKDLRSVNHEEASSLPVFHRPKDERDEARWCADILEKMADRGMDWTEMAVIYRTNRQALLLKQQLDSVYIPFRTLGGEWDVLSHWVALDLLSYLRAALDPSDSNSFFRILNRPGRYFSKAIVEQAKRDAHEHNLQPAAALRYRNLPGHLSQELAALNNHLTTLAKLPAAKALRRIRSRIGYDEFVGTVCEQLRLDRETALDAAHILTQLPEDNEDLAGFLERISQKDEGIHRRGSSEGVTLTTCHSAKGLEFSAVVIIGLVEDVFPHAKAVDGNSWSDLEEERRLLYVAATRARQHLFLSSPQNIRSKKADHSRFVDELSAGLPKEVRSEGDAIEHPSWGTCHIVDAVGSTVRLRTTDGAERTVLKSWLEERLSLTIE